jgi:general secretion pathway protein K
LSQHPAREPYDSLNQIWAGGPGGEGETNSPLLGASMDNYQIGAGTISVKIIDLERKVNVNTANSPELQQVLTVMGVDANDISVVSDSILDWRDADDAPRIAGAESDYYQGLNPPYYAKNAPIDNLAELLLIKGVTPEMYWGVSSTNQLPGKFQKPKLGFGTAPGQTPDYPFGLKDIFTPFSSGQININTADANVLSTIPGMDETAAESIIKYRSGPDGVDATEDDTPFRSVGQLAAAGISSALVGQISRYCTVGSSVFEVHITAKIGDSTRDYTAILWRNTGTDIEVVSFWWK